LLEAWMKAKMHGVAVHVVDRLPKATKDFFEDEEMPRFVSRGKDRLVDGVWPDVREELVWELAVMIDGQSPEQSLPTSGGVDCFRAYLRYHLFPYDKSFWGKLRDPIWVILKLVSLIPISGVCQFFYLFVFLIIDKRDEYQLIFFILDFKGTQYLSHGFIRMILGFFLYVLCASVPAEESDHNCNEYGPGMAGSLQVNFIAFFVQVALVWFAFFLLPCSKEKGRSQLKTLEHEHGTISTASQKKGGYLTRLLVYDLFCFVICMGVAAWVATTRDTMDDWPVRHALFACQVAYGYLSLPFFLFTIPYIQVILTHAVPTAYDRQGRVQRFKKPKKKKSEEEEAKRGFFTQYVSKAELGDVVDNMTAISRGMASTMLTQLTTAGGAAGQKLTTALATGPATGSPFMQQPTPIVLGTGPPTGARQ